MAWGYRLDQLQCSVHICIGIHEEVPLFLKKNLCCAHFYHKVGTEMHGYHHNCGFKGIPSGRKQRLHLPLFASSFFFFLCDGKVVLTKERCTYIS